MIALEHRERCMIYRNLLTHFQAGELASSITLDLWNRTSTITCSKTFTLFLLCFCNTNIR